MEARKGLLRVPKPAKGVLVHMGIWAGVVLFTFAILSSPNLVLMLRQRGVTEATQPPASFENPPIYPNAQVLSTQVGRKDHSDIGGPHRIIHLATADKPSAVLAFYRDRLVRDGWEIDNLYDKTHTLALYWSTHEEFGSTYKIEIDMLETDKSPITEVVITSTELPGY